MLNLIQKKTLSILYSILPWSCSANWQLLSDVQSWQIGMPLQ